MADEKKIIIDEDWKSRVESEKEELQRATEAKASPEAASDSKAQPAGSAVMPPASFSTHLSMLATEAAIAMGQLAHPNSGQQEKNLEQAKYLIDTIGMLEEKTRGNLTEAESAGLADLLHQLRMLFISVQAQS
ncbi:MAG: DUF1844 domain-containing protein [Pirellulales bacterium]|nr:DUF1844 domain-containing protein [Pirellulales bacterium]